jgi:hypothetical protein
MDSLDPANEPKLYRAFQAATDLLTPARLAAGFATAALGFAPPWVRDVPAVSRMAASWELLVRAGLTHHRPDYGIDSVRVGKEDVPVTVEEVVGTSFGGLVRFRKEGISGQPRLLLVAPLSGHFATLLRGTVQTLLPDNDVYITDWRNARDAPLSDGAFGFDEYVAHVIAFLEAIGPGAHLMGRGGVDGRGRQSGDPAQHDPDGRPRGHADQSDCGQQAGDRQADRMVRKEPDQHGAGALSRRRPPGLSGLRPGHRLPADEPGAPPRSAHRPVDPPGARP